jgi:hypothetical protein
MAGFPPMVTYCGFANHNRTTARVIQEFATKHQVYGISIDTAQHPNNYVDLELLEEILNTVEPFPTGIAFTSTRAVPEDVTLLETILSYDLEEVVLHWCRINPITFTKYLKRNTNLKVLRIYNSDIPDDTPDVDQYEMSVALGERPSFVHICLHARLHNRLFDGQGLMEGMRRNHNLIHTLNISNNGCTDAVEVREVHRQLQKDKQSAVLALPELECIAWVLPKEIIWGPIASFLTSYRFVVESQL